MVCGLALALGVVGCAWDRQAREDEKMFRDEQRGTVQDLLNRSSHGKPGAAQREPGAVLGDMNKHDGRLREIDRELGGE